ncbi:MAG: hypothetical protein DCF30_23480 [Hyphomicrobiales bacterium]|nr:MAG: hypothetical protein DCF30_23480 [Hyphomicrobiales bacterium]
MSATLLLRERLILTETAFAEIVIWRVPSSVRGSKHEFKYSLALIGDGVCVLRYDNEAGKGDHKHLAEQEVPYRFFDLERLRADFWSDVESWLAKRSNER